MAPARRRRHAARARPGEPEAVFRLGGARQRACVRGCAAQDGAGDAGRAAAPVQGALEHRRDEGRRDERVRARRRGARGRRDAGSRRRALDPGQGRQDEGRAGAGLGGLDRRAGHHRSRGGAGALRRRHRRRARAGQHRQGAFPLGNPASRRACHDRRRVRTHGGGRALLQLELEQGRGYLPLPHAVGCQPVALRRGSRRKAGVGPREGEAGRGDAVPVERVPGVDRGSRAARMAGPWRVRGAAVSHRAWRDASRSGALHPVARAYGAEGRAARVRVPDGGGGLGSVPAAHRGADGDHRRGARPRQRDPRGHGRRARGQHHRRQEAGLRAARRSGGGAVRRRKEEPDCVSCQAPAGPGGAAAGRARGRGGKVAGRVRLRAGAGARARRAAAPRRARSGNRGGRVGGERAGVDGAGARSHGLPVGPSVQG